MKILTSMSLFLFVPVLAFAGQHNDGASVANLTNTIYGYMGILVFIAAYALVPLENKIHLRKSKPVLMAAGVIWVLLSIAYISIGDTHTAHEAIKSNLLEYAELFLFLLTAMTYINAMEERNVFQALKAFLVSRGFSLKMIFWVTGLLAFFISPVADNLTTALLMGAVVMAVGGDNKKFVALACINTVVAANAGGAFSPFGDITTLMVWQKGNIQFTEFFLLFIPSMVNWLVPAIIMSFAISNAKPEVAKEEILMKYGAWGIIALFLCTIVTAVSFHNFLHLPPAAGMMLGLAYLGAYSYYIKLYEGQAERYDYILGARGSESISPLSDIFKSGKSPGKNIDSLPVAAFAIDTSHTITHWNKAMKKLTGIPASEAIGTKNQWKPFYQEQRPVLADLILDYMPGKEVEKYYEEQFRGKDGKWLSFSAVPLNDQNGNNIGVVEVMQDYTESKQATILFDLMKNIARAEWDTLLFFYGVIVCVGGLSQFGYLGMVSNYMYDGIGPTLANTMVGVLSAIVDNIPVMFAVLTMDPVMSKGQWLLVTLTAGVGGSMLSIGSAAGVALMGTARGTYTFGIHLKWTPVIVLGYAASIIVHLLINARLM